MQKMMKRLITLSLISISTGAFAAGDGKVTLTIDMWQLALYAALGISLLLLYISMHLLSSVKKMESKVLGAHDEAKRKYDEAFEKQPFWSRLFQLRPLSVERDALIDEDYDGIQELNNPTPPWFMWLFYLTIIFAVFYIFNYHILNISPLTDEEFRQEVAAAENTRKQFLKDNAIDITEDNVKLSNAAGIDKGAKLFAASCVACHGVKGEGTIGPNLTDNMWIHGGNLKEIFHTISEGVPAKGMVSWKSQLNPQQIADVASYVFTLRNSPAKGKAPEGTPFVEEKEAAAPAPDSTAKSATDAPAPEAK